MYTPRLESTRRALDDSTANLERLQLEEYGADLRAMQELLNEIKKQAQATRKSFREMDKSVAVLSERIKWIWYVVAAILGAVAYIAQGLFSWGLGKL